jgi:hypothetical protein
VESCGHKAILWKRIGNATEDIIRKYVQDQLQVMEKSELNSQQFGLL